MHQVIIVAGEVLVDLEQELDFQYQLLLDLIRLLLVLVVLEMEQQLVQLEQQVLMVTHQFFQLLLLLVVGMEHQDLLV